MDSRIAQALKWIWIVLGVLMVLGAFVFAAPIALAVMLALLGLILTGCAFIAHKIALAAERKGRVYKTWFWLSLFFTVPALIIIATLQDQPRAADATPAGNLKRCPDCAESVQAAARVCRYCQHRFEAADVSGPSPH